MSNIDLNHLLPRVITTAIDAGKATLEVYNTDFSVETKDDDSPVTLADKRAHEIIDHSLSFSNIPLLSEEGTDIPFDERKQWEYMWIIDPLDGTKEFVNKNSEFTVNIALVKNGEPVMGVIYVPVYDLLYYGSENGSYKLEKATEYLGQITDFESINQLSVKLPLDSSKNHEALIVVASKSHLNEKTKNYIEDLKKDNPKVEAVSRGSSLKLCLVAEGTADLYPRFGPTMEWDIAAGCAIIKFSGAQILRAEDNKPMVFNKENLLNPEFIAKRS